MILRFKKYQVLYPSGSVDHDKYSWTLHPCEIISEVNISSVVSTEETTLIGRISDVVRSGRGSDFVA